MKALLLSVSLSLCTLSAFAFPSFDPFADATAVTGGTPYTAGDTLAGETNVLLEGWYAMATSQSGAPVSLAAGSLTAPAGLTSSTGNMVQLVNQVGPGARYNVPITRTNTLFYSVLIQLQDITSLAAAKPDTQGGGAFNLGFNNAQTVGQAGEPTGYTAPIYYGNVTNSSGVSLGYMLGIGRGTGGTNRFWETNTNSLHQVGDVVFVVASYQFVAGVSNDIVSLWVNPDPSSFGADSAPTPTVIIDGVNNISADPDVNGGSIQSFVFGNRNTSTPNLMYADELRLGTTWADVTGGSKAVVVPTLSISLTDPNTVTLSWRGDATGYTLQGTSTLLSSGTPWANISGSATASGTNFIQTDSVSGMKFYRLISTQ